MYGRVAKIILIKWAVIIGMRIVVKRLVKKDEL